MTRSPWLPRLLLGAGAIGLLAAIISIAIGEGGPTKITISGGEPVQELVAGIAQDGAYLGSSDASVTIGVFNDLQCSPCVDYELHVVDPLIERYARSGDARLQFHHFSMGASETTRAAYAAAAAGEQDREWQYIELFFRNQDEAPHGTVSDEFLRDIGNAIPDFDLESWAAARKSQAVSDGVTADAKLATDLRLPVSPAVVVDGPGGTRELDDSPSLQDVEAAVAAVSG